MAIKDVLLPLLGDPSPGLIAAIEKCVNVAASFDAEITALAVEEDVSVRPSVMISADLGLPDEVKSTTGAQGLLKAFDAAVAEIGARNVQRVAHLMAGDAPEHLALCLSTSTELLLLGTIALRLQEPLAMPFRCCAGLAMCRSSQRPTGTRRRSSNRERQ